MNQILSAIYHIIKYHDKNVLSLACHDTAEDTVWMRISANYSSITTLLAKAVRFWEVNKQKLN